MKSLNEDLKTGQLNKVYLLYGEEAYLKKQYKDKLRNAMVSPDDNMNYAYYEGKGININEVIDLAETLPFFADIRVLMIENSGFFKNKCEELADYIEKAPLQGHSDICFIIGGFAGLPEEVKKEASLRLSFSRMTFTHQIMRIILIEQIYRAFTIITGGKYHK